MTLETKKTLTVISVFVLFNIVLSLVLNQNTTNYTLQYINVFALGILIVAYGAYLAKKEDYVSLRSYFWLVIIQSLIKIVL